MLVVAKSPAPKMEAEWARVKRAVGLANTVAPPPPAASAAPPPPPPLRAALKRATAESIERCRAERKKQRAKQTPKDRSDAAVARAAKWTDGLPLAEYEGILHLVPRLVNVVTLAEAIPVPGSGLKLPLDLHAIGARCSNAYFAPRRH